jgi:beta-glucosidase-like glycosyl hydrolase
MKLTFLFLLILQSFLTVAQQTPAQHWADSVFNTLNDDQRIAQLMVVRMSAPGTPGNAIIYNTQVRSLIQKYNIGSLCVFQGAPTQLSNYLNEFQQMAKTPLMVCIDGEWGLGMRIDSITNYPFQLTAGAVNNKQVIYDMGKAIGEQCKRMGIQVNYAPVVDINNNPANPVIGYRSFGEDKIKVGLYGSEITKGMQDAGIMACAKHFPGHGDVSVDSHYDLPVINKTKQQLTDLELYPFQQIFKANVGSVMIAHLYIPAIDNTVNRATSLSPANVTDLLRKEMGYNGISFTDALEMKGVAKFFPGGEAAVQSLVAGNDMLCLPSDVPKTIDEIKKAIKKKRLTWDAIYAKTKKVLEAKYNLGLNNRPVINLNNLVFDLNSKTNEIRQQVLEEAITALRNEQDAAAFLPLQKNSLQKIAYVAIGVGSDNVITKKMKAELGADVFFFDNKQSGGRVLSMVELLKKRYAKVVVGLHNYNKRPASNFLISAASTQLLKEITKQVKNVTFIAFGNPYALKLANLGSNVMPIAAYEDDVIAHNVCFEMLLGNDMMVGSLPVTVTSELKYGTGFQIGKKKLSTKLIQYLKDSNWRSYNEWTALHRKLLLTMPRLVL